MAIYPHLDMKFFNNLTLARGVHVNTQTEAVQDVEVPNLGQVTNLIGNAVSSGLQYQHETFQFDITQQSSIEIPYYYGTQRLVELSVTSNNGSSNFDVEADIGLPTSSAPRILVDFSKYYQARNGFDMPTNVTVRIGYLIDPSSFVRVDNHRENYTTTTDDEMFDIYLDAPSVSNGNPYTVYIESFSASTQNVTIQRIEYQEDTTTLVRILVPSPAEGEISFTYVAVVN